MTNTRKRMKRPADFVCVLGGAAWKVIFVRRGHPKVPGAIGMCYWAEKEIYVRFDLNRNTVRDTLIHEMLHANCHLLFVAEEWVEYTATELAKGMAKAGF